MVDVLIAGAGPAGSIAAIRLARAGARVLLVDRATFPRDKLCGDTLNPGAMRIADRAGVSQDTQQQVWVAKNKDGTFVVALFNINDKPANVSVKWGQLELDGAARVRDLWSHTELGEMPEGFGADLDPHACRLLKVTPVTK